MSGCINVLYYYDLFIIIIVIIVVIIILLWPTDKKPSGITCNDRQT